MEGEGDAEEVDGGVREEEEEGEAEEEVEEGKEEDKEEDQILQNLQARIEVGNLRLYPHDVHLRSFTRL